MSGRRVPGCLPGTLLRELSDIRYGPAQACALKPLNCCGEGLGHLANGVND